MPTISLGNHGWQARETPGRPPLGRVVRIAGRRAFTLIEVVLAMGITLGILAVVLFFYQQSERLRGQLLEETSRISAARLVMDRLAFELATAQRCELLGMGLRGSADTLQFARLEASPPASLTNAPAAFPFRWITYSLSRSTNADQPAGLVRAEEPLSRKSAEPVVAEDLASADEPSPLRHDLIPNTRLQFARFRYWNGADWQESWSAPNLPAGVEISLGAEALPPDVTGEGYPFELYRRIVHLPNGSAGSGPNLAGAREAVAP